ncbi:hypothetical protein M404DRAFT_150795, partial [Pisolithus tinctorius Marx 270]
TSTNPGRVVTLIHKDDWDHLSRRRCRLGRLHLFRITYIINPPNESEVRDYLGKFLLRTFHLWDGYTPEPLDVYTTKDGIERVTVRNLIQCVISAQNSVLMGLESPEALMDRIWGSVGPLGRTQDSLYQLREPVRKLAPASFDSRLFA